MTLVYIVLCDLAGETFPVCVCPNVFDAQQMVNQMQHKACFPEHIIGDYRVNFRVAEAPLADISAQTTEEFIKQFVGSRRAIRLDGKL